MCTPELSAVTPSVTALRGRTLQQVRRGLEGPAPVSRRGLCSGRGPVVVSSDLWSSYQLSLDMNPSALLGAGQCSQQISPLTSGSPGFRAE